MNSFLARARTVLLASGPTIKTVIFRIEEVAGGERIHTSNTCWNHVGRYLNLNPTTKGVLLFFGEKQPEYVNHVLLLGTDRRVLVDSMRESGRLSIDHKNYTTLNGDSLELIGTSPV